MPDRNTKPSQSCSECVSINSGNNHPKQSSSALEIATLNILIMVDADEKCKGMYSMYGKQSGTKRGEEFAKYENTPKRFFNLEVAFLREYNPDYPNNFRTTPKNWKRFEDRNAEGYLFKKQNKEYNLPQNDLVPLLKHLWKRLKKSEELNLSGKRPSSPTTAAKPLLKKSKPI